MALNLTEKNEHQEDYSPDEKKDLEFEGLNNEQAVEKFVEEIIQRFREKDSKEREKELKLSKNK
jgi:hypothetical protein